MGDKVLGGDKGLPPPELGFFSYITDALTAVKATNPDASFLDATATKKSKDQRSIDISVRFRVQSVMMVTVTGPDKSNFNISQPDDLMMGASSDISNLNTLSTLNDPVKIVTSNKKVQTYSSFRFYRPAPQTLAGNKKLIDQPYYEFIDGKTKLGLIGASDGKDYLGPK